MDRTTSLIRAVKAALGDGIATGHVIAVVGETFAGSDARGFTDDFIALDHATAAVFGGDDPLATEQSDGVLRRVSDRNKVNERVRLVSGQALPPVVIHEFFETGGEAGKRE